MVVSGFVEPITKELPLESAVEMNRLIQPQNLGLGWLKAHWGGSGLLILGLTH